MKKKIFFGILFSAILAINVISISKPGVSDLSLLSLMQNAKADGEGGGTTTCGHTCMAGGQFSTQCSYSGTITVMGSGVTVSNSITCTDEAYACCHLTAYCFARTDCAS